MNRHAARDVLLLPATHDSLSGLIAHQVDTSQDVPRRADTVEDAATSDFRDAQRLRVIIRRARITDLFALSRISPRSQMNHPNCSMTESDPVRATLRGVLPFVRNGQPVFVATTEEDRRILGFAQFRLVGPDQRWLAESIGANAGIYDPEPVVSEILHDAIKTAGLDGVRRLYAKVGPDSPIKNALRQSGFTPYSRERVMGAGAVPVMAAAAGVRLQEQSDVWSIHQLYLHSTPREVQYAEALTSHSWDVDAVLRSSGSACQGWLIEDDYLAVGYMRAISRHDAHIVDFMVSSTHRDTFPLLIANVFRELATLPSRRIYVVVRDYQSEFIPFLYEMGFGIEIAQEVHIRYTTASVRSSVMASGHQTVEVKKEPSARRVPTFFQGPMETYRMPEGPDGLLEGPSEFSSAIKHGD